LHYFSQVAVLCDTQLTVKAPKTMEFVHTIRQLHTILSQRN